MKHFPLDMETKEWIDAKVSWIIHHFGIDRIKRCSIVAADSRLLDNYDPNNVDSIATLFSKVCVLLDVDYDSIEFELIDGSRDPSSEKALGTYLAIPGARQSIAIDVSLLSSPVSLISTLAHELCHVLLIGEGRITGDEDDHEPLTDLLTVFLGFGALAANSVLEERSWLDGTNGRWELSVKGYMTMEMYGYAIAIFATLRGESTKEWSPRLRLSVRNAFARSMRYFATNGLPDYSMVVETMSRPQFRAAKVEEENVRPRRLWNYDDEDYEEPEEDFDFPVDTHLRSDLDDDSSPSGEENSNLCVYCRLPAIRVEPMLLCAECFESINENQRDLEELRVEEEAGNRFWRIFFYLCLLTVISVGVIGAVAQMVLSPPQP